MTVSVEDHLAAIAPAVRPLVEAARGLVRSTAPKATEMAYQSRPPRLASAMWKLARYDLEGANVAGIGAFTSHAAIYFYRGRELDDPAGLLKGSGKDMRFVALRTAVDVERPALRSLVEQAFERARSGRVA